MKDPIIEEVRRIRRKIAAEYRLDPVGAEERTRARLRAWRERVARSPRDPNWERNFLRQHLKDLAEWKRTRHRT
jgi:hypothetical protein